MHHTTAARSTIRLATRPAVAGVALLLAVLAIGILDRATASPSSLSTGGGAGADHLPARPSSTPARSLVVPGDPGRPAANRDRLVTVADGVLPDGVTVFDDEHPALANLDDGLLEALREAAKAAAADGVEVVVTSGWRSRAYQDELLRRAVAAYGSAAEAARWVATADTSPHVAGAAVDLGPSSATAWLVEHGAAFGLCQVYRNEPWHYELRPKAIDRGCPRMYADPRQDPRLQP